MSKCPVCDKEVDSLKTAIKNGQYVSERCEKCLANFSHSNIYSRKYDRDRDRENHRRDVTQRWDGDKPNPEFFKAYPKQAREQFGDELFRRYG